MLVVRSRTIAALVLTSTLGCGSSAPQGEEAGASPSGSGGDSSASTGSAGAPTGATGGAAAEGSGGTGGIAAPAIPAGTEFVTTDELNLRDGPGTDHAVITVMPPDSRVVVVDDASTETWAHVKYIFGDVVGYAHTDYLAAPPAPVDPSYDPWRAEVLAKKAIELWDGSSSGDMCLYGVDQSCKGSGVIPGSDAWPTLPSAIDWGNWAMEHPGEMMAFGFKQLDLAPGGIPQGSIIVWQPGQCGYHAIYGHIEIVVDHASSRACSDFCGTVQQSCGNPWTWIPITVP